MTADPTYPLYPICAFVGFVGCLIPLPWHLQSMNSGTCFFMFWTSLSCLNYFVNSLVWADNAINSAPVWCDISIRIILGSTVGIPMSSLCIVRRLYNITKVQAVSITPTEKRRAVMIDALLCLLFPILFIALQYVVQGHRFNLYEGVGCMPALYNTALMYVTTAMWPVVLGLCSAVYCGLTLHQFYKRRLQFAQFLHSGSSINASRYLRLMALALTEMLITTPLGVFGIVMNATATPVGPWRSWADTHLDYGRVEQIPAIIWRGQRLMLVATESSRWQVPLSAFVFIAFFCFAEEARRHYKLAFEAVCKRLGIKLPVGAGASGKLKQFKLPSPKCVSVPLLCSFLLSYLSQSPSCFPPSFLSSLPTSSSTNLSSPHTNRR
ncbi:fungal pheromone STE3G-protein-coupled receptor [Schizophyllum commune]